MTDLDYIRIQGAANAIAESALVAYWLYSHSPEGAVSHENWLIEKFDQLVPMVEALKARRRGSVA